MLRLDVSTCRAPGARRGSIRLAFVLGVVMTASGGQAATAQDAAVDPVRRADELFDRQAWSDAAEQYRKVVDADPENGRAWFRLGYSLHACKRLDEAIDAHRRATEFPYYRRVAWYNLGCAYALQDKPDAAFEALEQAVRTGFSRADYLETDSDLDSLRSDPRFSRLKEHMKEAWPAALRAMDFWVGTWDVFNADGVTVGVNRIESLEHGFLIQENWESVNGGTGRSTNYYDRDQAVWRQVWISSSGEVSTFAGNFEKGAMRFEGKSVKPDGSVELARIALTPRDDGTVRHFSQQSRDGGKTWHVYFDGTYVRRGGAPKAKTPPSGSDR